eukprot:PhF_6_TR35104/c3_g1_i1/m.51166
MSGQIHKKFAEDYLVSKFIIQYGCPNCDKTGWGPVGKKFTCRQCGIDAEEVPFEKQIGVAWFRCYCGRKFRSVAVGWAGFTCPCKNCGAAVRPLFFLPPSETSTRSEKKYAHDCSLCGNGNCPLVDYLK